MGNNTDIGRFVNLYEQESPLFNLDRRLKDLDYVRFCRMSGKWTLFDLIMIYQRKVPYLSFFCWLVEIERGLNLDNVPKMY